MQPRYDVSLLARFKSEIVDNVPHLADDRPGAQVLNPTPLVDVTGIVVDCARAEYGVTLPEKARFLAKLDSKILGGSVKMRPAVSMIDDAIRSGNLVSGQTVFEATSGNFGLALGMLGRLGFTVVAIVSRKLQPGVLEQLRKDGVRTIDLDIDICPAPWVQGGAALASAKGSAASVRQQLGDLGFDLKAFDSHRGEVESVLLKQDAIDLAKLLAKAYGGFCPEQYENELNTEAHRTITGPEIQQQLVELGLAMPETTFVCSFGTGGTASGIGAYQKSISHKSSVRVIFPLSGQDVAGIRTREKATGLRFYDRSMFAGEHEVDFEQARMVMTFFNSRGFDVGESGALVIYGCIQLANFGAGTSFVAMVADGASKYAAGPAKQVIAEGKKQVSLGEASANISSFGKVVWAHSMVVPLEAGKKVISESLGCSEEAIQVAKSADVMRALGGNLTEDMDRLLESDGRPTLLVCMAGQTTSLLVDALSQKGIRAVSLMGGLMGMPGSKTRRPEELLTVATS